MSELLRFAYALAVTPWRIFCDLFGPDDFDRFVAEQHQRFLDLHEGE